MITYLSYEYYTNWDIGQVTLFIKLAEISFFIISDQNLVECMTSTIG